MKSSRATPGTIDPEPAGAFLSAILQHYKIQDPREGDLNPLLRMWIQYALDTVKRGEHAVAVVGRHRPLRGASCLDVGCAYGGFPVAFARAGAAHVVGIDVEETLLACSRALVGEEGLDNCRIERTSILDDEAARALGTFDVVTCYDVLEHLERPGQALRNLAAVMRPGAILNAEIPNRLCPSNILSDPHYQLFGFSPLPWALADAYHGAALGQGRPCDVRYMTWPAYCRLFARAGLHPVVVNDLPADLDQELEAADRTFRTCLQERHLRTAHLPAPIRDAIDVRVARLARCFRSQLEIYRALRRSERGAARALGERLHVQFAIPTWQLTATVGTHRTAAQDEQSIPSPIQMARTPPVEGPPDDLAIAVRHGARAALRLLPAGARNMVRRVRDTVRARLSPSGGKFPSS